MGCATSKDPSPGEAMELPPRSPMSDDRRAQAGARRRSNWSDQSCETQAAHLRSATTTTTTAEGSGSPLESLISIVPVAPLAAERPRSNGPPAALQTAPPSMSEAVSGKAPLVNSLSLNASGAAVLMRTAGSVAMMKASGDTTDGTTDSTARGTPCAPAPEGPPPPSLQTAPQSSSEGAQRAPSRATLLDLTAVSKQVVQEFVDARALTADDDGPQSPLATAVQSVDCRRSGALGDPPTALTSFGMCPDCRLPPGGSAFCHATGKRHRCPLCGTTNIICPATGEGHR